MLLNENTLLVLDPKARGEPEAPTLEDIKNLPPQQKPTVLRATIQSITPDGRALIALETGQTFSAQLPRVLPQNTALLLLINQQQPPKAQLLRALLPPTGQNPKPQLQPSAQPPVLLDISESVHPKIGQTLRFASSSTPSIQQAQQIITPPTFTQLSQEPKPTTNLSPNAPTGTPIGALISGQIINLPEGGGQQLLTKSGAVFTLINPPVFEEQSQISVRFLRQNQVGQNQAILVTLEKPNLAQQPTSLPKEGQTPVPTVQTPPTQPSTQPQLWQLTPQTAPSATPPLPFQEAVQATVLQHKEGQLTLQLQTGERLTITPVPQQNTTQPPKAQVPQQSLASTTEEPTQSTTPKTAPPQDATPYPPRTTMTIRFTSTGLLEVLNISPPKERHPQQNLNQQTTQRPPQPGPLQSNASNQPQDNRIAIGRVVEQQPGGRLVLEFPQGTRLEVQAQRLLPVGSQVSLQIMSDGHGEIINVSLPKGSVQHNALLQFSVRWEGLQNTLEALKQTDPTLFKRAVSELPRPDETLLPRLIQLSQGFAEQNLKSLFGEDVINILRALGLDGMLKADMAQLHTLQQPRPDAADGWRALFFPYWDEQEQQARQGGFFWRRHKQQDENDAPQTNSIRFILSVDLSALGHVQLDGLMYEKEKLNLKLEIQNPLSLEEEKGLYSLVNKSIEALGLSGQMTIKHVNFFKIDPRHEMLIGDFTENDTTPNNFNIKA